MMEKDHKPTRRHILTVTAFGLLILAGLVAEGVLFGGKLHPVHAQVLDNGGARGFRCSNRTLKGRYGIKGDGLVPSGPPPAPLVPFAMVGIETLDGEGNLTDAATTSLNGVTASNVNQGTYTINEDCTGTFNVNIPVPPFQVNHHLVVVDKGNEFYLIASRGAVLTFSAKRLD